LSILPLLRSIRWLSTLTPLRRHHHKVRQILHSLLPCRCGSCVCPSSHQFVLLPAWMKVMSGALFESGVRTISEWMLCNAFCLLPHGTAAALLEISSRLPPIVDSPDCFPFLVNLFAVCSPRGLLEFNEQKPHTTTEIRH
jgi:hypothetical protein